MTQIDKFSNLESYISLRGRMLDKMSVLLQIVIHQFEAS